MLTPFGELITDIKASYNVKSKDIAKVLGTTPDYLSKVIHGKKNVPESWLATINRVYKASYKNKIELSVAAASSDDNYSFTPSKINPEVLPIIVYLTKKSNKLSQNQITELREILHLSI